MNAPRPFQNQVVVHRTRDIWIPQEYTSVDIHQLQESDKILNFGIDEIHPNHLLAFLCFQREVLYRPERWNQDNVWRIEEPLHPNESLCFKISEYPEYTRETGLDGEECLIVPHITYLSSEMRIFYDMYFNPTNPYVVKSVVSDSGAWLGIELVASREVSYADMRERLWGVLMPLSVSLREHLLTERYCSLITIGDAVYLLAGPLSHLQHEHGENCRFQSSIGSMMNFWSYENGFPPVTFHKLQSGSTPTLRLTEQPLVHPRTDKIYRTKWVVDERIVVDYGGSFEYFETTDFVCTCRTCRRRK